VLWEVTPGEGFFCMPKDDVWANLENLTEFFEKAFEGRVGFDY
jgi:hypothetical protein